MLGLVWWAIWKQGIQNFQILSFPTCDSQFGPINSILPLTSKFTHTGNRIPLIHQLTAPPSLTSQNTLTCNPPPSSFILYCLLFPLPLLIPWFTPSTKLSLQPTFLAKQLFARVLNNCCFAIGCWCGPIPIQPYTESTWLSSTLFLWWASWCTMVWLHSFTNRRVVQFETSHTCFGAVV